MTSVGFFNTEQPHQLATVPLRRGARSDRAHGKTPLAHGGANGPANRGDCLPVIGQVALGTTEIAHFYGVRLNQLWFMPCTHHGLHDLNGKATPSHGLCTLTNEISGAASEICRIPPIWRSAH
jgi:hypothetical protein